MRRRWRYSSRESAWEKYEASASQILFGNVQGPGQPLLLPTSKVGTVEGARNYGGLLGYRSSGLAPTLTVVGLGVFDNVGASRKSKGSADRRNSRLPLTLVRVGLGGCCRHKRPKTTGGLVGWTTHAVAGPCPSCLLPTLACAGLEGGWWRCTHFMQSLDPREATMPGRSLLGFYRPGRHHVHQAQSSVECSASRMKGQLHPIRTYGRGGLAHLAQTFLNVDGSFELHSLFSGVAISRDGKWGYHLTSSLGHYHAHLVGALPCARYVIPPSLCGVKCFRSAQYLPTWICCALTGATKPGLTIRPLSKRLETTPRVCLGTWHSLFVDRRPRRAQIRARRGAECRGGNLNRDNQRTWKEPAGDPQYMGDSKRT